MHIDSRAAVGAALLGGVGVALLTPQGVAARDEQKIDLTKLPKEVLAGAKEMFPKADWKQATKLTEDGETYYELAGVLPGKKLVVVEVDSDGDVYHIEAMVEPKDVPKVVMDAFRKAYPEAQYKIEVVFEVSEESEEEEDEDFEVTGYEFHAQRVTKPAKGKKGTKAKGKPAADVIEVFVTIEGEIEKDG